MPKIPFKLIYSLDVPTRNMYNFDRKLLQIPLYRLKTIKVKLGFILNMMKKITRWRHNNKKIINMSKKLNIPPLGMSWCEKKSKHSSKFTYRVWRECCFFRQNLINFEKVSENSMDRLGRATCIVHLISVQTSQGVI